MHIHEQSGEAMDAYLNRAVRRPLMHVQMDEDHFSLPHERHGSSAAMVPSRPAQLASSLPLPLVPLPA